MKSNRNEGNLKIKGFWIQVKWDTDVDKTDRKYEIVKPFLIGQID